MYRFRTGKDDKLVLQVEDFGEWRDARITDLCVQVDLRLWPVDDEPIKAGGTD